MQTKRCPHCHMDTYLSRWEKGKCPHCGKEVELLVEIFEKVGKDMEHENNT